MVSMAMAPAFADISTAPPCPAPRPVLETHSFPPYPELSRRLSEQGETVLQIAIGQDGSPQQVSLARSSGFERLDSAATDFVKANWRWQPLPSGCRMVSTRIAINWRLNNSQFEGLGPQSMLDVLSFVPLDPADYPPDALAARQKGAVLLAVFLSDKGVVANAIVIHGSGVASLDAKALELAKTRYHWTPAQMSGKPVGGLLLIGMLWVLPGEPVPSSDQIKATLGLFLQPESVPTPPQSPAPPPPPK